MTEPGKVRLLRLNTNPPEGVARTLHTSVMHFDDIKDVLSEKPLRRVQSYRDRLDAIAARKALNEPERISYDDARKELGLDE